MKTITKKTKFSEIARNKKAENLLMEKGMFCLGCPMAQHETLEQGAWSHGINPDELARELNAKLNKKQWKKKK